MEKRIWQVTDWEEGYNIISELRNSQGFDRDDFTMFLSGEKESPDRYFTWLCPSPENAEIVERAIERIVITEVLSPNEEILADLDYRLEDQAKMKAEIDKAFDKMMKSKKVKIIFFFMKIMSKFPKFKKDK